MTPAVLRLSVLLVFPGGLLAQGQKEIPDRVDLVGELVEKEKSAKAAPVEAVAPDEGQQTVRGVVEDAQGRPVVGAGLILGSAETLSTRAAMDEPLAQTDAAGKFVLRLQAPADKQAAKQRVYLLVAAEGHVAVRVKMPTLKYSTDASWTAAKNDLEERALLGLDLMARLWGRKTERKPAGVDLKRIVLRRGVTVRGLVTDAAGDPVGGVRVIAQDHLLSSRFRGLAKSGDHWSYAKTRPDGTFVLPGVLRTGSALEFSMPGYYDSSRVVIGSKAPVKIALRKAAKVSGKVLTSDGEPAAGKIKVVYEVSVSEHSETLSEGGTFGFELKHPHRYRLIVTPSGASAKQSVVTYSSILSEGQESLVLTLDAKPKVAKKKAAPKARPKPKPRPKLGFPVSVVDKSTGLPLETFKAGTIWVSPSFANHGPYLIAKGVPKVKSNKQPGYIRLQPPTPTNLKHGGVLVQAEGYAVNLTMVEWDEEAPPRLEIEMVPESVLSGVVREDNTGEPVPKAPVTCYCFNADRSKRWTNKVTADKAGRYRIRGLRAGHYRLMVNYKGRQAATRTIDLAVGEEREDLDFLVPSAAVVRGRIEGMQIGDGWKVQLLTEGNYRSLMGNPNYRPKGQTVALGKDGKFKVPDVKPGFYEVCVLIPQDAREGGGLLVPIEPIRVRKRPMDLVLDGSLDRPGTIRGKVTINGAAIDPARLLVIAMPARQPDPWAFSNRGNIDLTGSRCQVRPDQTFELRATSGPHDIRVIDLLTGVKLSSSEHLMKVRSGSRVVLDIRLELASVRIKIEAKAPGASTAASWLDIETKADDVGVMGWVFNTGGSLNKAATGISLVGHEGQLELLLPPKAVTLRVRSEAPSLARPKLKIRNVLGEAELTPRVGELNQVQIQVEVPTSGFDPEPPPMVDEGAADKAKEAEQRAPIKVPGVRRAGRLR